MNSLKQAVRKDLVFYGLLCGLIGGVMSTYLGIGVFAIFGFPGLVFSLATLLYFNYFFDKFNITYKWKIPFVIISVVAQIFAAFLAGLAIGFPFATFEPASWMLPVATGVGAFLAYGAFRAFLVADMFRWSAAAALIGFAPGLVIYAKDWFSDDWLIYMFLFSLWQGCVLAFFSWRYQKIIISKHE